MGTVADATGSVLDALIHQETATAVNAAIAELPQLQREALVLFEYDEMSLDEIAKVVGADLGTIKSRLHRARERLCKRLEPWRNQERYTK